MTEYDDCVCVHTHAAYVCMFYENAFDAHDKVCALAPVCMQSTLNPAGAGESAI